MSYGFWQVKAENYSIDLSFSSSFVSDLENDPDLVLALDKIEQKYKENTKQDKVNLKNKTAQETTKREPLSTSARSSVKSHSTESVFKVQRSANTPKRSGATNSSGTNNSFCDLSFASPIDISTPQIFKSTKQSSSKSVHVQLLSDKSSGKKTSHESKLSPDCTPRRSTQLSAKKKKVLHGQEDQSDKSKHNKSDFFKSLLSGNDSLEEGKFVSRGAETSGLAERVNQYHKQEVTKHNGAERETTVTGLGPSYVGRGRSESLIQDDVDVESANTSQQQAEVNNSSNNESILSVSSAQKIQPSRC